ncbi:hemicentin-2-like [Scylla paramamosain]|uniref:hemicentin-2-like n=1 Tax=Scylla paramamosain TaxID=85552 RepID=UPI003082BBEF
MGISTKNGTIVRKFLLIIIYVTLYKPLSVISVSLVPGAPGKTGFESSPLQEVWALEGGRAHLPCNITAPTPEDTPILVLFYNGVTGTPVYSIDARTVPLTRSVHWSALGTRAHFDATSLPQGLVVDDLSMADEGQYRCRVDFKASPTRNLRVALTVVVPPKRVSIRDESQKEVSGVIGPYAIDKQLTLTCNVEGGSPAPRVTWWDEGTLLDNVVEAGVLQEGNVSRSTVHLAPHRGQHGATLTCRAENAVLDGAVLEDSTKLNVHFSPKLTLHPGHNLNMADIKEGDDVYFECNIEANPAVFKVTWYLNGMELAHNVSAGVIQSNQSLVLQKVGRVSSGLYTCKAINLHGTGSSNAVQLSVKYAPVCAGGQKRVYGGGRFHTMNITCRVESHPEATSFRWAFNTSTEFSPVGGASVSPGGRGRSIAAYTPLTHHDFGSLLCWGRNEVDEQEEPCVFHIVPAGVPETVQNCSAWQSHTNTSNEPVVIVSCAPGWGAGCSRHSPWK